MTRIVDLHFGDLGGNPHGQRERLRKTFAHSELQLAQRKVFFLLHLRVKSLRNTKV